MMMIIPIPQKNWLLTVMGLKSWTYTRSLTYVGLCKDNSAVMHFKLKLYVFFTLVKLKPKKYYFNKISKYYLHPLKNPPSLNSFSPTSSGPMPTSDTPLTVKSGSSLLISDAIQRQIWQPNLRRKNKTTGWSCHRDWSSRCWKRERKKTLDFKLMIVNYLIKHFFLFDQLVVGLIIFHRIGRNVHSPKFKDTLFTIIARNCIVIHIHI